MFSDAERNVLQRQLDDKRQEQLDLDIKVEEIDLHVNKLLDLQVRERKKQLKALRSDLMAQKYNNALGIAELERSLYRGYDNVLEEIDNMLNKKTEEKENG